MLTPPRPRSAAPRGCGAWTALLTRAAPILLLASCAAFKGYLAPAPRCSPVAAECLAAQGQLPEALDEYRSLLRACPGNAEIVAGNRNTVAAAMTAADTEFLRGNLVAAGRGYRLLWDRYPDFAPFAASLPFDRTALRGKIDLCVKQLTTEGLQRYRRGEISSAITTWRGILTFDPENAEIRKAIDNAVIQEKTLKESK